MSDLANRAEQAKRLLADPLFVEARQTVEAELKDLIVSLSLSDIAQREQAVAMFKGFQAGMQFFDLVISGYQLEKAELLQQEQIEARHQAINERIDRGQ